MLHLAKHLLGKSQAINHLHILSRDVSQVWHRHESVNKRLDGAYIIWIAEKPVHVIGKPVFDLIDGDICMRKHTDSCTVFERHSIR